MKKPVSMREKRELQRREDGWYGRVTIFLLHPTKGWRKEKSSGWRKLRAA